MEWATAVTAVTGAVIGVSGVAFGYLTSTQERKERLAAAESAFRRERLTVLDARAFERRASTYQDVLLTAGVMAVILEACVPTLRDVIGDDGGRPAQLGSGNWLAEPSLSALISVEEVARLAASAAAFGSRAVSETVEAFVASWLDAVTLRNPIAAALGFELDLSRLAAIKARSQPQEGGEPEAEADNQTTTLTALAIQSSVLRTITAVDEVVYMSTLLAAERDTATTELQRSEAVHAWLSEASRPCEMWDQVGAMNSSGTLIEALVSHQREPWGWDRSIFEDLLDPDVSFDMERLSSRGTHLVQSGHWFAENSDEWWLSMGFARRRRRWWSDVVTNGCGQLR